MRRMGVWALCFKTNKTEYTSSNYQQMPCDHEADDERGFVLVKINKTLSSPRKVTSKRLQLFDSK